VVIGPQAYVASHARIERLALVNSLSGIAAPARVLLEGPD